MQLVTRVSDRQAARPHELIDSEPRKTFRSADTAVKFLKKGIVGKALGIFFLKRFRSQCQSMRPSEQGAILRALLHLEPALANPREHLGLRKLRPRPASGRFGVGTHDEVRRFLRDLG